MKRTLIGFVLGSLLFGAYSATANDEAGTSTDQIQQLRVEQARSWREFMSAPTTLAAIAAYQQYLMHVRRAGIVKMERQGTPITAAARDATALADLIAVCDQQLIAAQTDTAATHFLRLREKYNEQLVEVVRVSTRPASTGR